MKRLLIFTVLLMSMLICVSAFAAGPKKQAKPVREKPFTFIGKGEYDPKIDMYHMDDYEPDSEKFTGVYYIGIKKGTPEFQKCIGDGKYKGVVEITAIVSSVPYDKAHHPVEFVIDKTSTCKRR